MRKLIGVFIALAAAPILALVALLPAMADVNVAGANACAPQSANPHPTDPAGSTTATIFCVPATPTPGTGTTGSGNGNSGSNTSNGTGSRGTSNGGGGATTTLASSTSTSTTPDESMRFDWQSNGATAAKSAGTGSQPANSGQVTGGLLAFFSGVGGLIFLFSLLALLVLIGLVAAAIAWMRHGRVPWAAHAARLTYRPKP